jgi:hypothetical protein
MTCILASPNYYVQADYTVGLEKNQTADQAIGGLENVTQSG